MGFGKNKEESEKVYANLAKMKATVTNVRQVSDTFISFTLKCEGFSLYNMQLVEARDGRTFINPPSSKGNDGKWYPQYALYLSETDKKALEEEVIKCLDV